MEDKFSSLPEKLQQLILWHAADIDNTSTGEIKCRPEVLHNVMAGFILEAYKLLVDDVRKVVLDGEEKNEG